jgi:hypothetical protein
MSSYTCQPSHTNYYQCSLTEIHQEVQRRKHLREGHHDQLCESLGKDDDARGSDATTVSTHLSPTCSLRALTQTSEFGQITEPNLLVNERA